LQLATISGINYLVVKPSLLEKPSTLSSNTPATNVLDAWWTFAQVMKRNVAPILEREHQMDFGDFMVLNPLTEAQITQVYSANAPASHQVASRGCSKT
jgi:hypothetical protein